jgi:hypothetical protein
MSLETIVNEIKKYGDKASAYKMALYKGQRNKLNQLNHEMDFQLEKTLDAIQEAISAEAVKRD